MGKSQCSYIQTSDPTKWNIPIVFNPNVVIITSYDKNIFEFDYIRKYVRNSFVCLYHLYTAVEHIINVRSSTIKLHSK